MSAVFTWGYRRLLYNIADLLARNPALLSVVLHETLECSSGEIKSRVAQGYELDSWFQETGNTERLEFEFENDLYYNEKGQILVSDDDEGRLREYCIEMHHDPPYVGHLGRERTVELLRSYLFWPGIRKDVSKFIATFDSCQRIKAANQAPGGLLQPLETPKVLWESFSMELITLLPETSRGNTAIVVFVDRMSKMVRLAPVRTKIDAESCAHVFVREFFAKHGMPTSIVSDRNPRFTSEFFMHLCRLLGMKQRMSTSYHPQTDGQTDRMNRTREEMFRAFVEPSWPSFTDRDVHLPCYEFAMNNPFNESIKTTPFSLNCGRHPITPTDFAFAGIAEQPKSFIRDMAVALERVWQCTRVAQQRMAKYANQKTRPLEFAVGDWVLLDSSMLKNQRHGSSQFQRFIGPYQILKRVGPWGYELETTADMGIHHI